MFVINRSAAAVLAPLALLLAAALWSNRDTAPSPQTAHTVTASQTTVARLDSAATQSP